ncbi:MAG: TrkH family potassium uptake protein [Firmicutes bacterium]|nr:TrkH family potassium uptake protein [Bacillota bacterium]
MSHRLRDTILIQGYILLVMAAAMLVPCGIGFYQGEDEAATAFALTLIGCFFFGSYIVMYWKPSPARVKARDGFLVVSVSWLVASAAGAIPMYASGAIPSFIDAFFESCSGFTTTGSSILSDVEALPDSVLIWRSFTHWLGGMGILVFVMALLPSLGISGQNVANAETPGPTKDKVTARFSETARDLYFIYIIMTIIETVLLVIGGLSWFDALIHTFGSVGTGGFSNYNSSVGHFHNPFAEWVIIIFMFLSGVNFNLYYLTGRNGLKTLVKDDEFRFYGGVIALFSGLIFVCRSFTGGFAGFQALGEIFRDTVFQVVTIITTTGYMTDDYDIWPTFAKMLLFTLFFIGGCASSTGGGLKCIRILVAIKLVSRGISLKLHPRRIANVTVNRRELNNDVVINITNFIFTYMLVLGAGFLLISLNGFDFISSFSAAATCLGNIGPGFNLFGPTMNFSIMSGFSKLVCSFLMLIGRLELFTMLVLFSRHYWNPNKC